MSVDGFLARLLDAIQRRISRFARLHVFARSLPEICGGGGYVEQVVSDLKQQTKMRTVGGYSFQFVFIGAADEHELKAITAYGAHLGLVFQITDDLLDVTATAADLGKTPGKDVQSRKATYPALYGIEESREKAVNAHRAACEALEQLDRPTEVLHRIVDFILHRTG